MKLDSDFIVLYLLRYLSIVVVYKRDLGLPLFNCFLLKFSALLSGFARLLLYLMRGFTSVVVCVGIIVAYVVVVVVVVVSRVAILVVRIGVFALC